MVVFARQNLIADPPFSRMDLISCRNLLIYLNRPAQRRVLETFHFALRPGRYLFLGAAETADGSGDLFVALDTHGSVYQSRPLAIRRSPQTLHRIRRHYQR